MVDFIIFGSSTVIVLWPGGEVGVCKTFYDGSIPSKTSGINAKEFRCLVRSKLRLFQDARPVVWLF